MKFGWEKVSSLLGHTETRQTVETSEETSRAFTIVASRYGVTFRGDLNVEIATIEDLDVFAKAIDRAWRDHLSLKPKISGLEH